MAMLELSPLDQRFLSAVESIAYELKRQNDMVADDNNRLVTCAEAAEICKVTKQTISAWIRRGKLKKTRRGGRYGILLNDLPKRYERNPQ